MKCKQYVQRAIISTALLLSAQVGFAASNTFTCPAADTLKNFDGDYVEVMPTGFDSQAHIMTTSIMQKKAVSDTEQMIFILSGISVAEGENEEDKSRNLIGHLQADSESSTPFWISGPKGNHYFTDHYEHICSYTMPGNEQVKAVVFYVKNLNEKTSPEN